VTVILVLLVVYLGLANWWHRHQARRLQALIAEMVLEQMEPPETETEFPGFVGSEPPTWTFTLN